MSLRAVMNSTRRRCGACVIPASTSVHTSALTYLLPTSGDEADLPEVPLVLDGEFRRANELDELFAVETEPLRLPLGRGRHVVHALRQRRHARTDQRPVPTPGHAYTYYYKNKTGISFS